MNEISDNHRNSTDLSRLYRLACKELVEILRDRRTIITLVLMPLLVYPLMGIVVQKLILQSMLKQEKIQYNIGFENEDHAKAFTTNVSFGEKRILYEIQQNQQDGADKNDSKAKSLKAEVNAALKGGQEPDEVLYFFANGAPLDLLVRKGEIDLGVKLMDLDDGTIGYRLLYNAQNNFSLRALRYIEKRIRYSNESFFKTEAKPKANGLLPTRLREQLVESEAEQPVLLTFVPLMLVLMTITGAVYPAIDLTAGERERGTMEILVAAPVSRLVVLIGKFVAVLAVAILTAIANIVAMTVTIYALGLDSLIFGDAVFNVSVLFVVFILLVVLAAFFSATLLCLTSFARSFKEAQAYLIPLMLVAFAPGLISLTPNLKTGVVLSVIPLVNIVLSGRDLLAGQADSFCVAISVFSTAIYGLMALSLAARIFGTDSILTGGKSSWSDLLSKSKDPKTVPTMQSVMIFLAILFPAFVVASGISSNLAGKLELTVFQLLLINAGITVLLFVLIPYLFARISQFQIRATFALFKPSVVSIITGLVLGCSVWMLIYEMEILTLNDERVARLVESFAAIKVGFNETPLWTKLLCLALVPAVCEEFTFRGFLLSGLNGRLNWLSAVIITAILFGLFHVFFRGSLMFERMLPSTCMGVLLGIVCIRSGSIYPGMILHCLHNGMLVSMAHYEKELEQYWGLGAVDQQHLPGTWLSLSAVLVLVGLLLLSTKLQATAIKPDLEV